MTIILISMDPMLTPEQEAEVEAFEAMIKALDNRSLDRAGWEKLAAAIVEATVESGRIDHGASAYASALERWRMCRAYDHD